MYMFHILLFILKSGILFCFRHNYRRFMLNLWTNKRTTSWTYFKALHSIYLATEKWESFSSTCIVALRWFRLTAFSFLSIAETLVYFWGVSNLMFKISGVFVRAIWLWLTDYPPPPVPNKRRGKKSSCQFGFFNFLFYGPIWLSDL